MPREFLKDKTRIKIEDVSVFNVIPLSLYTCLQKNAYVSKTKIKKGTPLFYNMCIHTFLCMYNVRKKHKQYMRAFIMSCNVKVRIWRIVYRVSCIVYRVSCNVHRQAKLSSVSCYGLYFQCCSVVLILYL